MVRENADEDQRDEIDEALIRPASDTSWSDEEAWADFTAAMRSPLA